jgi:IS5 family transposase
VHDVTITAKLLHGEEENVHGDSVFLGADQHEDALTRNKRGKKTQYKINRRPSQRKHNTVRSMGQIKRREREKSSVRAKVEHVFGVVKGTFGYPKTRYKRRRKQDEKLHMVFALANLYLADKRFGLAV